MISCHTSPFFFATPTSSWGEGAAEACLLSHSQFTSTSDLLQKTASSADVDPPEALQLACSNALFDLKVQQGEDIRYNHALASACALDKTLFCRDIQPAKGGVVPCLTSHTNEPGFSSECVAGVRFLVSVGVGYVRVHCQMHKD